MHCVPSCLILSRVAGYFITKIFHPNIASNGEICVNTLKKDWKPDCTLAYVFQTIRCLLIVPFPESSLNDDAGKLFMEDYDEYFRKAKLMTQIHAMGSKSSSSATAETSTTTAAAEGSAAGAPGSASVDAPGLSNGKPSSINVDAAAAKKPAAAAPAAAPAAEKKKSALKRL